MYSAASANSLQLKKFSKFRGMVNNCCVVGCTNYVNKNCIIDCSEIYIEMPASFSARSQNLF